MWEKYKKSTRKVQENYRKTRETTGKGEKSTGEAHSFRLRTLKDLYVEFWFLRRKERESKSREKHRKSKEKIRKQEVFPPTAPRPSALGFFLFATSPSEGGLDSSCISFFFLKQAFPPIRD